MAIGTAAAAEMPSLFGRMSLPFLRRGAADDKGGTQRAGSGRRKPRFQVGKARWVALVLLALFLAFRTWDPLPLETVRLKVFDFYQQLKPRALLPNSPVVIIDLDDPSLETVGQWPWPRNVVAQMIANLFNMGVGVVGFDVFFPEPDRMNANNVVNSLVGLDEETKQRLLTLPSNDAVFGDIIRQARRVVLGMALLPEPRDYSGQKPLPSKVTELAKAGAPKPQLWVPPAPGILRNIAELEASAGGYGLVYLLPEVDGIVRRVPAFARNEDRLFPALSVEMLRVAAGRQSVVARGDAAGIYEVAIAPQLKVQTDRRGLMWPYFSKHDPDKYVSAKDVLSGVVDKSRIAGKLALIGTSAQGLLDIKTVPTERFIPGVEVHAQLMESVLTGQFLTSPNYADAVEMAIALFAGLMIIVLVPWIGAKWTLLFFLAVATGAGGTSWYLFSEHHVLVDAAYGITAILILYVVLTYMGYASEEAQRRQTREAFGKYLSPAMVERVVEDPSLLSLGGAKRDMTILFCDVRGFTSISELFDAEGLTVLINKLLTPLTEVILANKGTVDKYMGDAIMAFWNAPLDDDLHAEDACSAALKMVAEMGPLNERLEAEAKAEGRKHIPLKVGLGLNSGEAVVGNMGTAQRMDYSVLGDTVNTAARLEGQSKTYGVDIVIGPNTLERAPNFATIELDIIQVKGKTVGLKIFALMGEETLATNPEFIAMRDAVDTMLTTYRSQQWERALALIEELREIGKPFKLDTLCDLYQSRIRTYQIDPPPADWDGVFIATSK